MEPLIQAGPLNQGEWGECVIYAATTVIQEQLNHKYDTAIEDAECIALLTPLLSAFAGAAGGHQVVEAVNRKLSEPAGPGGQHALLFHSAKGRQHAELYALRMRGAKQVSFAGLCRDADERDGLGAFAVVCIRTSTQGHAGHAVAAYKHVRTQAGDVVLARNSWGGQQPVFQVTAENYIHHCTFGVDIAVTYRKDRRFDNPKAQPIYHAIREANRLQMGQGGGGGALQHTNSKAQLVKLHRDEKRRRERAEGEAAQFKAAAAQKDQELKAVREQLAALKAAAGGPGGAKAAGGKGDFQVPILVPAKKSIFDSVHNLYKAIEGKRITLRNRNGEYLYASEMPYPGNVQGGAARFMVRFTNSPMSATAQRKKATFIVQVRDTLAVWFDEYDEHCRTADWLLQSGQPFKLTDQQSTNESRHFNICK